MNPVDEFKSSLATIKAEERPRKLLEIADGYMVTDPEQAMHYAEEALKLGRSANDPELIASALNSVGKACFQLGNFDSALGFHFEALEFTESAANRAGQANTLNLIGVNYSSLADYEQALRYLKRALETAELSAMDFGVAQISNNIGIIYAAQGDHDQAAFFHERALERFTLLNDKGEMANTLNNLGIVVLNKGDRKKALALYKSSLALKEEVGDRAGAGAILHNIGEIYLRTNDYQAAIESLEQALQIATELKLLDLQRGVYLTMATVHERQRDYENALNCFRQHCQIKDEIFNRERVTQIDELQTRYEIVQKEQALRRNEAFTRSILDALPVHVAVIDGMGTIVQMNQAWMDFEAEFGGRNSESVVTVGSNFYEILQQAMADGQPYIREIYEGLHGLSSGASSDFEITVPGIKGSGANSLNSTENDASAANIASKSERQLEWFLLKAVKCCVDDEYLVITRTNITRQKAAERAQVENTERLAVTLRSIGDGVITTNIDGEILLINRVAESLLGVSQAEVEGQHIGSVLRLVDEQTGQPVPNPVLSVLKTDQPVQLSGNVMLLTADDRKVPIADTCAPIRDRENNIIGTVLVFRDETETRRFTLAKANFLNAISHELRTPLTPIIGYAQIMMNDNLSPDSRESIQVILESAMREKALVEELITIARIESGNEVYNYTLVDAHEFLTEICQNHERFLKNAAQYRYQTQAVTYQNFIDPELHQTTINIDEQKFQQIVNGLLMNAIKYSKPERLVVSFTATRLIDQVEIIVSDEGVGIPRNEQERVFELFYQIRKSATDVSDGIGQGLAMARRHLEAHNGTISVKSEVGVGSRFIIKIPIRKSSTAEKSSAGAVAPQPILIVEDDKVTAHFLSKLLHASGYETETVYEAEKALDMMTERQFSLVMLDMQLTDMDGDEILAELEARGLRTPVVLCSAYSNDLLEQIHRQYSFTYGYVTKPFNNDELIACVDGIMNRKAVVR